MFDELKTGTVGFQASKITEENTTEKYLVSM
jgi:hypothetical protein